MGTVRVFLAAASLLFALGCASHHKVETWRFNRCARNGDHFVCQCEKQHSELNAKSGLVVTVCD